MGNNFWRGLFGEDFRGIIFEKVFLGRAFGEEKFGEKFGGPMLGEESFTLFFVKRGGEVLPIFLEELFSGFWCT